MVSAVSANSGNGNIDAARSTPPTPPQAGGSYSVQRGDTLAAIAQRFGTDVATLASLNGIRNPNLIYAGQRLTLPQGASQSYEIRRGDTMAGIAAANGVSLSALVAANPQVSNPNRIYPGDSLRIPASGVGGTAPTVPAQAPRVGAPATPEPIVAAPVTGGQIDLRAFFDPSRASNSPAAIVIGNAEGTRTPSGGRTSAYAGHIDPGNGVGNRGSFSYQHGAGLTPQQADTAQLNRLSRLIPAYEAAVRRAGLDPNNATLATAYFDLYNQSPTAAARFLNQVGDLRATGITQQSVADLRFHSFVDKNTGQRFTYTGSDGRTHRAGGGFATIARNNLGRAPTEAEIQRVIRADQTRRETAMATAMRSQGIGADGTQGAALTPRPETVSPRPVDAGATAATPRFTYNRGIDLPASVIGPANSLYDNVRAATGYSIHVTSGRRLAPRQADAMYNNYADGTAPRYRNRAAEAEIRAAYNMGRSNGWSKAQTVRAMTEVIQGQVNNGVYISSHMRSNGLDIRTPPANVLEAIRNDPNVRNVGVENDHIHIDFR